MLDGTNLVCDETHIVPGKIEKNGVNNIRALAELIED
jgi:2-phosphoglycerate kinase